jgi:hypothetical protein
MSDLICDIKDCSNKATKLTTTETAYIEICDSCWHKKYKA